MTSTQMPPATVLGPRLMAPFVSRRYRMVIFRHLTVARSIYWIFVSGFFEPVFYLFSMSVGIGELVGNLEYDGRSVGYVAFVAPALLASSAMNGAVFESTMNVFHRLRHEGTYKAMVATPLSPRDIATGELAWCQMRGLFYAAPFLALMAVMGLVESWWGVLALPAAVLVGVAFAATGLALTTYMRSWQDFELIPLLLMPLFLLSATFYPLSTYPPVLRLIVQATPLYHGVALIRQLTLDAVSWTALGHVVYLAVLSLIAGRIAFKRFDLLLRR